MKYNYQILGEERIYRGFFKVDKYRLNIEYFEGGTSGEIIRECLGKGGYVASALAYDPKKRQIILIEQFRIGAMVAGINPWQLELVAGFVEQGETAESTIKRELEEEIGASQAKITRICEYFGSPGGSAGRIVLFFAEVDSDKIAEFTGLHEEGEDIKVHKFSYEEVFASINNPQNPHCRIDNANTLMAVQYFYMYLQDKKIPS